MANNDLTRHHLTQQGFRPVTSPVTSPVTDPSPTRHLTRHRPVTDPSPHPSPTRHRPVTDPSPMKNPNRTAIIFRFWQWAAMHSQEFQYFRVRLDKSPVSLSILWSRRTEEMFVLRLAICRANLVLDFPHSEFMAFIHAIKNQGGIINPDIFENIAF
jgi:hypothetical protein